MLGVDWIRVYPPIVFGFFLNNALFRKKGRMIKLRGIIEETKL